MNKTKLTAMDIAILMDTVYGTLSVSDGGNLWKYSKETRKAMGEKLINILSEIEMDVTEVKGQA